MKDFDSRFEKASRQFDRDFDRARKWTIGLFFVGLTISLGLMGFGIWVVLLLLRHFGVL